jgi:hypothetical protein
LALRVQPMSAEETSATELLSRSKTEAARLVERAWNICCTWEGLRGLALRLLPRPSP